MPPEDEAITSLFFKDTNPSDPNKDKTEGFGWTKRRETNPRKSHQIKEEKVSHQFQSLVMDILEQNEKAF